MSKINTRERLLGIGDLNIAQRLMYMNDSQFAGYVRTLKSYVEDFPEREAELKNALQAEDYLSLSKCLVTMKDMLSAIYAESLAEECRKQLNGLVNTKRERIEAYITYLLSTMVMLSIDIQMALYNGADNDADSGDAQPNGAAAAEPESGVKSILAVDDNPFFLDSLKMVLQDSGYKLACVTSGKAALKFLQNRTPDLFILDIDMPEMDGYELSQKIIDLGHKAPIIFLTGNAKKEYVIRAVKIGAADFIIKPINKKHALERISKLM